MKHLLSRPQFGRRIKDPTTPESGKPKFSGFGKGKSALLQPDRPKGLLPKPRIHGHSKKSVKRSRRAR